MPPSPPPAAAARAKVPHVGSYNVALSDSHRIVKPDIFKPQSAGQEAFVHPINQAYIAPSFPLGCSPASASDLRPNHEDAHTPEAPDGSYPASAFTGEFLVYRQKVPNLRQNFQCSTIWAASRTDWT